MKIINIQPNGTLQFDPYDPNLPSIEVTDEVADALWNGTMVYKDGEIQDISEIIYIDHLRQLRDEECFPIINRGKLWYDNLTAEQLGELQNWYKSWLDVTETRVIPEKLEWL